MQCHFLRLNELFSKYLHMRIVFLYFIHSSIYNNIIFLLNLQYYFYNQKTNDSSTCSVHEVENEKVVSCALEEGNKLISDSAMKWVLVAPYALNNWHRRGLNVHGLTVEQSKCLIRVNGLDGDETNGFFVSYFERQHLIDRYTQTNLKEEKIDTELVNLPPGVEAFYNGEFRQDVTLDIEQIEENIIPKNHDTNTTASLENNKRSSSNIQKGKKVNVEKQLTVISAKKRKKLDWKKKQKELKVERLKKRESNPP